MDIQTVKSSIECRWRFKQVKTYGSLFLIGPLFTLLIATFSAIGTTLDPSSIWEVIGWTTGYMSILYGIIFLPMMLYSLCRYRELVKNYPNYSVHTVILDKPHTSVLYKNAVYFTVSIAGHGTADTSPLFSDAFFSTFTLNEYAGKTVRVLYDEEKGKVYLIGKSKPPAKPEA